MDTVWVVMAGERDYEEPIAVYPDEAAAQAFADALDQTVVDEGWNRVNADPYVREVPWHKEAQLRSGR